MLGLAVVEAQDGSGSLPLSQTSGSLPPPWRPSALAARRLAASSHCRCRHPWATCKPCLFFFFRVMISLRFLLVVDYVVCAYMIYYILETHSTLHIILYGLIFQLLTWNSRHIVCCGKRLKQSIIFWQRLGMVVCCSPFCPTAARPLLFPLFVVIPLICH